MMFVSHQGLLQKINIAQKIIYIAIVILELSILDIQTMLPFMVKTHLVQVKTTLPPQAQIHTSTLHLLILICIATTIILVSPTLIAATVTMNATAEAEQLILLATNNLLIIPQVQAWTMKSDLLQLGPLKIHAHTNSHKPLQREHHTFTTLLRTQETLELQRCLSTTWNGVALLYQVTPHIPAGLLLLQQLLS